MSLYDIKLGWLHASKNRRRLITLVLGPNACKLHQRLIEFFDNTQSMAELLLCSERLSRHLAHPTGTMVLRLCPTACI